MGKGKGEGEGEGEGEEERKGKGKGKEKGKGRWKEDSLRKVGRTHGRTHGHSGDFILCPMLCIALDRQKYNETKTITKTTLLLVV